MIMKQKSTTSHRTIGRRRIPPHIASSRQPSANGNHGIARANQTAAAIGHGESQGLRTLNLAT
jgi:hypothetical protein